MNCTGTAIRYRKQKAICAAMAILFLGCVYANAALADPGCGFSCYCQSKTTTMHHGVGAKMQPSAGRCDEIPKLPCNLKAGRALQLSVYIMSNAGADESDTIGPAGNLNLYRIDTINPFPCHLPGVLEKSKSPPLYLQKSSLRI